MQTNTEKKIFSLKSFAFENILQCKMFYIETNRALFGMSWVMPRRVVDFWACWQGWLGGSSSSYCDLEGHPALLDVMPLEGEKCTNL